jgi:hypothetical protein
MAAPIDVDSLHLLDAASISADVNWNELPRAVSYQLYSPEAGWIPITRATYAMCKNPSTRRILIRDEKRILTEPLIA